MQEIIKMALLGHGYSVEVVESLMAITAATAN
jgi:hypothetical protein